MQWAWRRCELAVTTLGRSNRGGPSKLARAAIVLLVVCQRCMSRSTQAITCRLRPPVQEGSQPEVSMNSISRRADAVELCKLTVGLPHQAIRAIGPSPSIQAAYGIW